MRFLKIALMVLTLLLSFPVYFSRAYSPQAPLTTLEQAILGIHTPEELARFMRQNFIFKDDQTLFSTVDYWQTPSQLWQRKSGDCEDYALFAQFALEQMGKEAHVVSLYGKGSYAHTLVVFKDRGLYRVMNEDRLEPCQTETIEAALSSVYAGWTWGAIAEEKGSRGWLVERIDHPVLTEK